MKISSRKYFIEDTFFFSSLAALLAYGAGWLFLLLPLVLVAATLLWVFRSSLKEDRVALFPPGMIPLAFLAGLPLIQLIPLPPVVLKFIFPGTADLYGGTIWLADPGAWMPVSLYPKATLEAFWALALNSGVYLLSANLLQEKPRLEKTAATLTTLTATVVIVSALVEFFPSLGRAPADGSGSSKISHIQALWVILLPMLLLFAAYRLSLLRHYSLREKMGEFFSRKGMGFAGLTTTTLSFVLVCLHLTLRPAPVLLAVAAGVLILCGLRLFLNRRRRMLSRPAFAAAFFFCLVAVLAGGPDKPNKRIDSENTMQAGLELQWPIKAETAARLLVKFPVLGTGLGTGGIVSSRLAGIADGTTAQEKMVDLADSVGGAGVAGVFLGGWFCVSLLRRIVGRRQEPKDKLADCLFTGSLAGLLAGAILCVSGMLPVAGSGSLFFLAGLAAAVASLPGGKNGAVDVVTGISARPHKAIAGLAVLVAGTCLLSTLGTAGGRIRYPEAWQVREGEGAGHPGLAGSTNRARHAGMLDPLEGRYPFAQGESWLAAGNLPAALRTFADALERDPLNGQYLQALGAAEAREGDRNKGERLILAGLRDRAALAERQEFYARWLAASARTEEAMQVMREGLTRAPGQSRSFLQMMVLEGIPLRKLRQALPERSRCFLDYADYQRESGDRHGARKSYQFALDLAISEMDADPSDFWRLYHYFSSEGDDEAALTALQAGLRLYPRHSELRCFSAETYQRLGLDYRAEEEYRRTLLIDPDNIRAKQGLEELAAD